MKHLSASLVLLLLAGITSAPALADTYTYTYTGHDFTYAETPFNTSDSVNGSFTLSSPLGTNLSAFPIGPTEFSFSAGPVTISNGNSLPPPLFMVYTDTLGGIIGWGIDLTSSNDLNFLASTNEPGYTSDAALSGSAEAFNLSDPGTWTMTVNPSVAATPEPSSLVLLGTGLFGAAAILRRRLTP